MEDFMILHYKNKLVEISEDISVIQANINECREIIDESWSGKSADICDEKLESTKMDLSKADNDITDAIDMLDSIRGELT